MTTEDDFLRAIKATPDDDHLRLVFADWLEDQGQTERAEFIRIQVELASPSFNPNHVTLEAEERQLLEQHGAGWLGRWGGVGTFNRGLISLKCNNPEQLRRLLEKEGAEGELRWVEDLILTGEGAEVLSLLGPWLLNLTSLHRWKPFRG